MTRSVAWGTTEPVLSVTVPSIELLNCAKTGTHKRAATTIRCPSHMEVFRRTNTTPLVQLLNAVSFGSYKNVTPAAVESASVTLIFELGIVYARDVRLSIFIDSV